MVAIETVLDSILQAMATGFGIAVGSYLGTRGVVKSFEKFEKMMNRKNNDG